jgi:hypothetical protein
MCSDDDDNDPDGTAIDSHNDEFVVDNERDAEPAAEVCSVCGGESGACTCPYK